MKKTLKLQQRHHCVFKNSDSAKEHWHTAGPSAQRQLIPLQASDGEGPVCHFILLALPAKASILCLDSL
jgi:hypothetical protein